MSDISRSEHIESLKLLLDFIENNNLFTLADSISQSLRFAIDSLEVDEAYQIMYEGGEIFTKDDMVAMLKELRYDLYHALCHEIHGKEEDCPCNNQTTSCLATFRVCDANEAIYKVIQQKINALKENSCGNNKRKD